MPTRASRREARERALELLYEAAAKDEPVADVVAALPVPPDEFSVALACGVDERRHDLDVMIGRYAIDWSVERMPVVDRTLLRMGAFELQHRPDVPTAVVISEAVELAKRFSTEESGRFVNGVLARIADEVRRPS